MGQLTMDIPKSLLPIKGKPFLYYQLHQLVDQGIKEIILCLGHLGEKIENYIKMYFDLDLEIKFVYDGKYALGTGGSILNAMKYLPNEFFVLYGDSYLNINYRTVYNEYICSDKQALLTIFHNMGNFDSSNVYLKNNDEIIYSKNNKNENMNFIDYGLSLFAKNVFKKYYSHNVFDLSIVLESLSIQKQLAYCKAKNRFYEIGSKNGYNDLKKYITQKF